MSALDIPSDWLPLYNADDSIGGWCSPELHAQMLAHPRLKQAAEAQQASRTTLVCTVPGKRSGRGVRAPRWPK